MALRGLRVRHASAATLRVEQGKPSVLQVVQDVFGQGLPDMRTRSGAADGMILVGVDLHLRKVRGGGGKGKQREERK